MDPPRDWGLGVQFRDLNGDRFPDLIVSNDNGSPDRFWINTGRGTFRALATDAVRHGSRSSMGLDVADVDRDGQDDVLIVDMLARDSATRMRHAGRGGPGSTPPEPVEVRPVFNRNSLFLGRGLESYVETALMAGIAATDWSWCPAFIDVDLDGYEDLLITNGFDQDVSGDYFDYIPLTPHRLGVAIADVSGKGIPASLITAMCRGVLRR